VARWDAIASPAPRRVEVRSPRPVEEARSILGELLDGRRRPTARERSHGGLRLEGAIDGSAVSFTATRGTGTQPPTLAFDGTLAEGDGGSVLTGSITAPLAYGLPAVALTAGLALFLLWSGVPVVLVALGVIAWVFLTVVVLAAIQEQRLADADLVRAVLEDVLGVRDDPVDLPIVLDMPGMADANERR
jgi:hypothetical protein